MSLFGESEDPKAGKDAAGAFLDPPALLDHLRKHTSAYNADVDAGRLVSPACTRVRPIRRVTRARSGSTRGWKRSVMR